MTRQLTAHSSLETLRKEAKRWLKALRAHDLEAHDLEAHERLRRSHPGAPLQPGLRDIQPLLLAASRDLEEVAELLLDLGCGGSRRKEPDPQSIASSIP